jgi:spore maturation protein CgeB
LVYGSVYDLFINIKYQDLPLAVEEGKHYVVYNNINDLVVKVRYYSKYDDERLEIAQAGKNMFAKFYDTKKHGDYIEKFIKEEL